MTLHRVDVLSGFTQLAVGARGLGNQRADPSVIGVVGEMAELLVDDAQFFVEMFESAAHFNEPPLDELAGHSP